MNEKPIVYADKDGKRFVPQLLEEDISTTEQCTRCAFFGDDDDIRCIDADDVARCLDDELRNGIGRFCWVPEEQTVTIDVASWREQREALKKAGWQLEDELPLNRFQNRIVQSLMPGDTPESGWIEQYAIHVPAGILAWRYPPKAPPAPDVPDVLNVPAATPAPVLASEKPTNPKDAIGIRKAPMSALPMNVIAEMGAGLLEGAAKYGRHNYRGVGVRASVYFDATMRHLIAWWEGEDEDLDTADLDAEGNPIPGTGMSHVAKALCSLAVLRDAQMQGKCTDDRPPRSVEFYPTLNKRAGAILDRHAGKNPKHYTIEDSDGQ